LKLTPNKPLIKAAVLILALSAAGVAWHHRAHDSTAAAGTHAAPGGPGSPFGDKPVPVVAGTAKTQDFPLSMSANGTVTANTTVTVHTLVNGTLQQVFFREGQMVKKGDLLAKVDSRPFEVALTQAQGTLAKDKALLENARVDLTRYEGLSKISAATQQQLDTQKSLVRQYEATVQSDQGAVAASQLNITYSRIVAPVSGKVGLRQVDPGNLVQTSDASGLVVLTEVNPITVVFPVSQSDLSQVLAEVHRKAVAAQGASDASAENSPESSIAVQAWDQDNQHLLATGKLLAVDNEIDVTTGTAKIKAVFDNADGTLFPNEFVNVKLTVGSLDGATVIPSSAIQRGAQGTIVWLIKPDNTVTVRPVRTKESAGEQVAVLSGLKSGDKVAVDGFDRLREGGKVELVSSASRTATASAHAHKKGPDGASAPLAASAVAAKN
jgi:multidrug efflux system membrane fusion protein